MTVGVVHWRRAALELHRTCRGAERIPLQVNSGSGSTSKAAGVVGEAPGVEVRKAATAERNSEESVPLQGVDSPLLAPQAPQVQTSGS
ncbi:hypothetical protein NDU88_001420 [Pleurodeles waltl]|uniref:Uncharacterized protein n=1 Tax=Pleurodeles waltl TaxID=8319 RepID=A0AAV7RAA2_PLEWA|nr:hypothetical protein NDU88_001420 [Pleurodeles waltl]